MATTEKCEPLRRLKSVEAEWTWKRTYDKLYNKAKTIIKVHACMKFGNEKEPLYM